MSERLVCQWSRNDSRTSQTSRVATVCAATHAHGVLPYPRVAPVHALQPLVCDVEEV